MAVKLTRQAVDKIKSLGAVPPALTEAMQRDFPDRQFDKRLDVTDYSADLWVRPADGTFLVYRFDDVDGDGVQDVVILSVLTEDEITPTDDMVAAWHRTPPAGLAPQLSAQLAQFVVA